MIRPTLPPNRERMGGTQGTPMMDVILKRFENPDETRVFEKGKFEIVNVGGLTIGRATYEPGWKWSEHVGRPNGESCCQVEHVGLVLSGQAVAKMDDGREVVMRTGDFSTSHPGMTAGSSATSRTSRRRSAQGVDR